MTDPMQSVDHDRDVDRLDRRIDKVEHDIQTLDQQGSRGVVALQTQVQGLTTAIGELKGTISALRVEVRSEVKLVKAGRWQIALGIAALIVPLYAGVIFNYVK
jgi:hypothetical protein